MQFLRVSTLILVLTSTVSTYGISVHQYAPEYDKPTDYSFSYGVKDQHTRDFKHQWEKKEGDTITGQYSLVEPDGSVRVVDYTASEKSGFNAIIKKSGPLRHITNEHHDAISHNNVQLIPVHATPYSNEEQPQYQYEYAEQSDDEPEDKNHTDDETLQGYDYVKPEDIAAAEESKKVILTTNYKFIKPVLNIKEEYEQVKYLPNLPFDLDFLKKDPLEKIIPADIEVIKPVEIRLINNNATRINKNDFAQNRPVRNHQKPSREVKETLPADIPDKTNQYITKTTLNNVVVESGFKPMGASSNDPILHSTVTGRNTYQSAKKPQNNPGLKHFPAIVDNNRYNNNPRKINYEFNYLQLGKKAGGTRNRKRAEVNRLYRSVNNDGYTRYAKTIHLQGV